MILTKIAILFGFICSLFFFATGSVEKAIYLILYAILFILLLIESKIK